MNRQVKYSAVPVGEKIVYHGQEYTRFTYERGKYFINNKVAFKHIPNHAIVEWVNAWPNQTE